MENQQRKNLETFVLSILPEPSQVDFVVSPRGNLFAVKPVSLSGQRYADQFLRRSNDVWPDRILLIDANDFVDVVAGIQRSGLSVGGVS